MPRLQFSLRAILILMAAVGAAIVVYRWPWTETKVTKSETTTTQFHRGWTGKALKHGVQRITTNSPIVNEDWYEDDELRRKRVVQGDIVYNDQSFRNGQLDGPYVDLGSHGTTRGHYRAGKKHGAWQYSSLQGVVDDEVWRNGERHGPRSWTTPQGRVLQTADYAGDGLTHWNGQPLAEEFRRWVSTAIPDAGLQRMLLMENAESVNVEFRLHFGEFPYYVGDELFIVQWRDAYPMTAIPNGGRPVGEEILEDALEHSHILSYRFGLLHRVPITPQELDWQDRTGVYDIRFPPGSAAEQFWLSPVADHQWQPAYPLNRLQGLFHPSQCPVEVDMSNAKLMDPALISPYPNLPPSFPRIRRNLVGQYLNQAGYRCELRGTTLVIKPLAITTNPATIIKSVGPGPK